jgi:PhnB protein
MIRAKRKRVLIQRVLTDAAEGQRIFDALADGGSVRMPLQKTFWSPS